MNVSNKFYSFLVKIFVCFNNPQITKARVIEFELSKYEIIYFFVLSMLVGISEAIRLLLTFFIKLIAINLINLYFFIKKNIILFKYSQTFFFSDIKYSGFIYDISFNTEQNKRINERSSNPFNE